MRCPLSYSNPRFCSLNQSGMSALSSAAVGGHTVPVRCLLDKGADVDEKDEVSYTKMQVSCVDMISHKNQFEIINGFCVKLTVMRCSDSTSPFN